MSEMTDRGVINFDSAAMSEIRGIVCRIPRALRSPCSEKEVINSFVQAGWTDRETLQAPDLKVLFQTLKRAWTVEEEEKWVGILPELVQEFVNHGAISEQVFRAWYPY